MIEVIMLWRYKHFVVYLSIEFDEKKKIRYNCQAAYFLFDFFSIFFSVDINIS